MLGSWNMSSSFILGYSSHIENLHEFYLRPVLAGDKKFLHFQHAILKGLSESFYKTQIHPQTTSQSALSHFPPLRKETPKGTRCNFFHFHFQSKPVQPSNNIYSFIKTTFHHLKYSIIFLSRTKNKNKLMFWQLWTLRKCLKLPQIQKLQFLLESENLGAR